MNVTAFLSVTLFLKFTSFNTSTRGVLESGINKYIAGFLLNIFLLLFVIFSHHKLQIKNEFNLPLDCDVFGKICRFYVKKGRYAKASERADFDRHFILTELHFGLSFDNYDELGHWLTPR